MTGPRSLIKMCPDPAGRLGPGLWLTLLALTVAPMLPAQTPPGNERPPRPAGANWGNQRDGTYVNPVLPSDYSDIDCIRVGDDYYAISSTFQFSPGVVILHSRDLVNWTIAGHAVDRPHANRPGVELGPDEPLRQGRLGRVHPLSRRPVLDLFRHAGRGLFHDHRRQHRRAVGALHAVLREAGWDDCCPFWDDDGQGYFVGSCFRDGYKIHLWKLTPDGRDLVKESDHVIYQSRGSEANKLYKINGLYYHFFSEVHPEGRVIMMERATNLFGPYNEEQQLKHADRDAQEPNQGGFVEGPGGQWYFFTHHGDGNWAGRVDSLLPVTWRGGWPIVGAVGADGIGGMVWSGRKPVADTPVVTPQSSDEFNQPVLGPQWEWNYQPRADQWSLTERPGWLRLHAFRPLEADNLLKAGNTLTQRVFRTATNEVVVKLDLSGLADGQQAGLCHFSKTWSTLGVKQEGAVRTLINVDRGVTTPGPALTGALLWLRSIWGPDGRSQYSYSLDGRTFTDFGAPYQLGWGNYRGDRIGVYSFNNQGEAGYLDVDYFHYAYAGSAN